MNFCRSCGTALPRSAGAPESSGSLAGARMPSAAEVVGRSASLASQRRPPSADPVGRPPAAAGQLSCAKCGGRTPEGYRFCQQCGSPLAPSGSIAQAKTDPAEGGGKRAPAPAATRRPPGVRTSPSIGEVGLSVDASAATLSASGESAQDLLRRAEEMARRRTIEEDPAIQTTLPETPVERIGHTPAPQVAVTESGQQVAVGAAWGRLITVLQDGSDGGACTLVGETVEIGRSGSGLCFEADRYLAPTHARLDYRDGHCNVVPIDRVNGVFRRLRRPVELSDGDIVLLGRELMRFELVSDDERGASPVVQGGVARLGSPPRDPWGRLTLLLPNLGERDVRYLTIPEVVIGREDGHIVFNDDEFLSRRHAILRWNGSFCTLEDLRSSNGSYHRLRGATRLEDGDFLRLGNQLFRFEAS